MKKLSKTLISLLATAAVTAALVMILFYWMHGMFLFGVPDAKDVSKITVEDLGRTGSTREFTDQETIKLACNLTNFLNYTFGEADISKDAVYSITYEKNDGTTVKLSANEDTVWWKDRPRPIKEQGAFIKLAEGVFWKELDD